MKGHLPRGILQFTPEGKLVKRYNSFTDAASSVGLKGLSALTQATKSPLQNLSKGYLWLMDYQYEDLTGRGIQIFYKNPQVSQVKPWFIYKIENLRNHWVYIGRTQDPKGRWEKHKSALRTGRNNKSFTSAFRDSSGIEDFSFEILDQLPSTLEDFQLSEIERSWVNRYLPKVYNKGSTGIGDTNHLGSKRIIQFTPNGQQIKIFNSLKEAARSVGLASSVSLTQTKKDPLRKLAAGYMWIFEEDYSNLLQQGQEIKYMGNRK